MEPQRQSSDMLVAEISLPQEQPPEVSGKYKCSCSLRFRTRGERRRHEKKVHGILRLSCNKLYSPKLMRIHLRGAETCSECNKDLGCQYAVLLHRAQHHGALICQSLQTKSLWEKKVVSIPVHSLALKSSTFCCIWHIFYYSAFGQTPVKCQPA